MPREPESREPDDGEDVHPGHADEFEVRIRRTVESERAGQLPIQLDRIHVTPRFALLVNGPVREADIRYPSAAVDRTETPIDGRCP